MPIRVTCVSTSLDRVLAGLMLFPTVLLMLESLGSSRSKVGGLLCVKGFPLDKKARRFYWKQDPPPDGCILFHPQDD